MSETTPAIPVKLSDKSGPEEMPRKEIACETAQNTCERLRFQHKTSTKPATGPRVVVEHVINTPSKMPKEPEMPDGPLQKEIGFQIIQEPAVEIMIPQNTDEREETENASQGWFEDEDGTETSDNEREGRIRESLRNLSKDYLKDFAEIAGLCQSIYPRNNEEKQYINSVIKKLKNWNTVLAQMHQTIDKKQAEILFIDAMKTVMVILVKHLETNKELQEANIFKNKLIKLIEPETSKGRYSDLEVEETTPQPGCSGAKDEEQDGWAAWLEDEEVDTEDNNAWEAKTKRDQEKIKVRKCSVMDCPYVQKASSGSNMAAHYRKYHGIKDMTMGLVYGKCTYENMTPTEFTIWHRKWQGKSYRLRKAHKTISTKEPVIKPQFREMNKEP